MRHCKIAAAIAAAALFGVAAVADTPAAAQNVVDVSAAEVDPSVVQPGADSLVFTAPMPALGSEYATPTQFVADGRAEFNWGDHLLLALQVFGGLIVTGIAGLLAAGYTRATGNKLEADDAARLREYTASAYQFALNAVGPATRGKKLTVTEAAPVVEWMIEYIDRLAPQLMNSFGGRDAQRLRSWSHVDLAEGEAIPLAPVASAPIAAPKAPSASAVAKRPLA